MDAWERGAGGLYFIVWQPIVAAHNIVGYNGCRWREIKLRAPRRAAPTSADKVGRTLSSHCLHYHNYRLQLALRILHQLVQQ